MKHKASLSLCDVDLIACDVPILKVDRWRTPAQTDTGVVNSKASQVLRWGTGSCRYQECMHSLVIL